MKLAIVTLLLVFAAAGCTSPQNYAKIRRERLLEIYPVGITSRDDVHSKWQSAPDFSIVRPAEDWSALDNTWIRDHVLAAQIRVSQPIFRCERYWGPDDFFSLCRCWFYYDQSDKLVDAEWEWMSD